MDEQFKTWEELSELEQLESIYVEMHKDVYGVKARWYKAKSVEQARADLAVLERELKEKEKADAIAQQAAIDGFYKVMSAHNIDFETAKRWHHQMYNTQGDDEYLCYNLGLPYKFFEKAAQTA